MFVEDVIQFTKENYNEIYLVYPQQSNNSVVIPFRNITIEIAWKSLKWFEFLSIYSNSQPQWEKAKSRSYSIVL